MVFTAEGVRHLVAEVGASQPLVGTDFPYPWTRTAVDLILDTPGLSDADRSAILGGTAMKLLGIKGQLRAGQELKRGPARPPIRAMLRPGGPDP